MSWHVPLQINDEINTPSSFSDLRFSNDGKWILGVVESKIYVLDAFSGNVVNRFSNGASPDSPYSLEAAFTPDSQFIVAGEARGEAHAQLWFAEQCMLACALVQPPPGCCK
jgi:WD40 repeat protein